MFKKKRQIRFKRLQHGSGKSKTTTSKKREKNKFEALSNFDIDSVLKHYKHYKGTFSRDMLPSKIKNHEMGVINLDDFGGPGTHWVAYYNDPNHKYVYYFDSFGLPPPEEVKKYLKSSGKEIQYSTSEIQDINSIMCGYYTVYVLKELSKGQSFYDAVYTFDPWPSKNNELEINKISKKIF